MRGGEGRDIETETDTKRERERERERELTKYIDNHGIADDGRDIVSDEEDDNCKAK